MRLCLSQGLPTDTEYLTLSHCWGQKHFTTLTRESFHSFLCEIPTDLLTKTFKDAIAITRKLGFRYIWIDSLCIFQGDLSDWRAESALMANVYGNSTLNIAAADAPDGDTGCFFERTSFKLKGWKIPTYTEKKGLFGTAWIGASTSVYIKTVFWQNEDRSFRTVFYPLEYCTLVHDRYPGSAEKAVLARHSPEWQMLVMFVNPGERHRA